MADEKKGSAVKLKKTSKRYENYEVSSGSVKRKNKSCPKCGAGVFLAKHQDRLYCGKCHYVEMTGSEGKEEKKPEEKKK